MPVSVDVPARVDLRAHVAHWRGGLAGQFGLAGLAIFGTASIATRRRRAAAAAIAVDALSRIADDLVSVSA